MREFDRARRASRDGDPMHGVPGVGRRLRSKEHGDMSRKERISMKARVPCSLLAMQRGDTSKGSGGLGDGCLSMH